MEEEVDARQASEDALLAFAQCVREEGIDIPDPEFDEDGTIRFGGGAGLEEFDPDELLEARDACADTLEAVTLTGLGFDRTQIEDSLYAYAACMREEGFDMPDPDLSGFLRRILGPPSEEPVDIEAIGPFGAIDIEDPEFIAADEVCRPRAFAGIGDLADNPPRRLGGSDE